MGKKKVHKAVAEVLQEMWRDGFHETSNGRTIRLKKMDESHIINTIACYSHLDTTPLQDELRRRGNGDLFYFDGKKHVYTLNGKRLYGITSVLQVIAKPALIGWAAKMVVQHIEEHGKICPSQEGEVHLVVTRGLLNEAKGAHARRRDEGAVTGTSVHEKIEKLIRTAIKSTNGKIPVTTRSRDPIVQKFLKWAKDENIKFLETEKKLYSKTYWIAGTVDLIFEKDGKKYVGDIKTTGGIYDRTPFFQCAGYQLMLEEAGQTDFAGRCIIRLGKDKGDFEVVYSEHPIDRVGFLSALELFKALEIPASPLQTHIKKAVKKKKHGN